MVYIYTLFDPNRDSRPLATVLFDPKTKDFKFYVLYLSKSGRKIYDIEQDIKTIADRLNGAGVICMNDVKQHLIGYHLGQLISGDVFDYPITTSKIPGTLPEIKKLLVENIVKMCRTGMNKWNKIRAEAACVYRDLQIRGVLFGYEKVYPIWHMDTYSGRTRTTGFNIQGQEDAAPLMSINHDPVFLHFDWVSADLRVAAIMSGDEKLLNSFIDTDPYTHMAAHVNVGVADRPLTRDESKIILLKSLYAMDTTSPALGFYCGLRDWMLKCKSEVEASNKLTNLLGRCYETDEGEERTILSVFNSAIQGTVALAMQAAIRTVWEMYPDRILAEHHDSLVMTSMQDRKLMATIIKDVADIITHPFRGVIETDPVFPVVVSVGTTYKKWRQYRRYNG